MLDLGPRGSDDSEPADFRVFVSNVLCAERPSEVTAKTPQTAYCQLPTSLAARPRAGRSRQEQAATTYISNGLEIHEIKNSIGGIHARIRSGSIAYSSAAVR